MFFIIFWTSYFYLLKFCSLLSTDAQYLVWKLLQFLNGIVSSQERSSTIKLLYLHSKYPHFNSTDLGRVSYWPRKTVYSTLLVINLGPLLLVHGSYNEKRRVGSMYLSTFNSSVASSSHCWHLQSTRLQCKMCHHLSGKKWIHFL